MGARSALAPAGSPFDRIDAALGVDVDALEIACLDIVDPRGAMAVRIKIGVKHACRPGKLKLCADAFANLDPRLAEMSNQLAGRHAIKASMIMIVVRDRAVDR